MLLQSVEDARQQEDPAALVKMEQVQKFPGMLTALDPCYYALLLRELWFLVCLFEILSPALCPLQEGRWIVTSTKHDFCAQQLQMMSDWTELIDTKMNPASLHLGFRVLGFFSNPLWHSTWCTHERLYQAHGYYDEPSIIGFRVLGFGPFFPILFRIWTSAQQGLKIMQRKLQILC